MAELTKKQRLILLVWLERNAEELLSDLRRSCELVDAEFKAGTLDNNTDHWELWLVYCRMRGLLKTINILLEEAEKPGGTSK